MAWVGRSSPFPCAGAGAGTSVLGWWAGKGSVPARYSNFVLYVYINATVLLCSIKDPLEMRRAGLPSGRLGFSRLC